MASSDPSSSSSIIFLLVCLGYLYYFIARKLRSCRSSNIPTNWPLLGMIPALLQNAHRVHDFATDILRESGGTFLFKGPWVADMDMVITANPSDIHYVLSKNFLNYPKGAHFRKMFDILGDGIFNSDFELWEIHRRVTMSLLKDARFLNLLQETVQNKVELGLIPVLEHTSKQQVHMDLQQIFQRLTFDSICKLVLDYDPKSLSIDLPYIPCEKAFTDMEEALLYRHIFPQRFWELQNQLGIGKEKLLREAWMAFDDFIHNCISLKEKQQQGQTSNCSEEEDFDMLTALTRAFKEQSGVSSGDFRKFLRDALLSLMIAGRDTTSAALTWFFYLLSKNPSAQSKIQEEIQIQLRIKQGQRWKCLRLEELQKLKYLHGALCETLRLFPPVALEHKAPLQADILPSGHAVAPDTKIILSFYSMGRMESIWGKDCLEFKPERWISERGMVKHEPSFKFPAFHAGPRTCVGKETAFVQMKTVAAAILYNYDIELVEGHPVCPGDSIILQMKHGLKVSVAKKSFKE